MKYSKYNVVEELSDGIRLLYNTLSEALLTLSQEDYEYFCGCLSDPEAENDDRYSVFLDQGILVQDEYSEDNLIRYMNRNWAYSNDCLQVTIAPTMACNMQCIYCFETHRAGKMSESVQADTLSFIKTQLINMGYKRMHIDWFGGEPLLCWDIVDKMASELISFCDKNDIAYTSAITTNGSLLTQQIVSDMTRLRISRAQITIDGDSRQHNSRKRLLNGDDSFASITGNLEYFRGVEEIDVCLRVNVDSSNPDAVMKVDEFVSKLSLDNASVYPARMEFFPQTNPSMKEVSMSVESFARTVMLPYFKRYPSLYKLPPKCLSCQAERKGAFAINEKGFLYKCWNEMSNPASAFGHVTDYPNGMRWPNFLRYMGQDIFSNPECRDCKVMPICMAGCIYLRSHNNEESCIPEKYALKEMILGLYYNVIQRKEENTI